MQTILFQAISSNKTHLFGNIAVITDADVSHLPSKRRKRLSDALDPIIQIFSPSRLFPPPFRLPTGFRQDANALVVVSTALKSRGINSI